MGRARGLRISHKGTDCSRRSCCATTSTTATFAAENDGSVGRSQLPDRVDALINSRIREVSDPERKLLEVAAVEGESFTIEAVARVAGVPVSDAVALCSGILAERCIVAADGHRGRLYQAGLPIQVRTRPVPDRLCSLSWTASNSPTCEVGLPMRWWRVGVGDMGSRISVVPRLYELAGRQAEAVPHIAAEAESLIRRGLNDEAATLLRRALRYASEVGLDGATQSRLYARLGFAVSITEGFASSAAERSYERAAELIGRAGIDRGTMPVAFGLWVMYASRGDFDRADRLVRAMRRVASGEGDPIGLQTEHAAWTTSLFAGRLDDAEHRIRRALATYRTADHHPTTFSYGNHDPGVCAGSLGSLTAALRGQAFLAHQRALEARRLSDDLGHAVSAAQAAALGVWTATISGGAGAVEQIEGGCRRCIGGTALEPAGTGNPGMGPPT